MTRTRPMSSPAVHGPFIDILDGTQVLGYSCVTGSVNNQLLVYHRSRTVRHPAPSADERLLYHQLWRAFLRGSQSSSSSEHTRPALPVELIRMLIRAMGCMVPDNQQTKRPEESLFLRVTTRDEKPIASRVWFCTDPLNVVDIAAIRLITFSRDQGWVSPPTDVCHSWYEWGVFPRDVPAKAQATGALTGNEPVWTKGKEAKWHRTHGNPVASRSYEQHDGPLVGLDDEMWLDAPAESVIVVRACAQQALWENNASCVEVLVWKWFEPVIPVL
ncbi:hypothetical protein FB45DRAFT_905023 [Roridomyces roridus]|uniref:Uncharacterized protein n=1 Tax=Roridomyces roridus TaxID=1738132 RepID=A0AAD7FVE6_9AGAR|nr:hypothetical protein FB45DRAFT_905023 [Roridomyces roridus]